MNTYILYVNVKKKNAISLHQALKLFGGLEEEKISAAFKPY